MENIINLETEYSKHTGNHYSIAVSSGTAALHLSLVALGIGKGDSVIIPDFTMAAVGFAVAYTGAKAITVDCNDNFNIDPSLIEEKIAPNTKAIIAVHTYGRLCDIASIWDIAKKYDLRVIEDCCEAQGATTSGFSDIQVFSFYKNKIIHAEEGGMVCTNNKEIADNIRDLKNMAFGKKHDYYHGRIGFNYRMPDSQAKMVLDSLSEYEKNILKRRKFERVWKNIVPTNARDAVWVYDFLCKSAKDKEDKIDELNKKGIAWRHFFKPLSTMPMFYQSVGQNALDFSNRGLYICYEN